MSDASSLLTPLADSEPDLASALESIKAIDPVVDLRGVVVAAPTVTWRTTV